MWLLLWIKMIGLRSMDTGREELRKRGMGFWSVKNQKQSWSLYSSTPKPFPPSSSPTHPKANPKPSILPSILPSFLPHPSAAESSTQSKHFPRVEPANQPAPTIINPESFSLVGLGCAFRLLGPGHTKQETQAQEGNGVDGASKIAKRDARADWGGGGGGGFGGLGVSWLGR